MTQGKFRYYICKSNFNKRVFMRKIFQIIFMTIIFVLFSACGTTASDSISSDSKTVITDGQTLEDTSFRNSSIKIPTLVLIMNWTNYSENDPLVWHNKIFNKEVNSVNRWYYDSTNAGVEFVPVKESSGTLNDGVIIVNMNKSHPGGADDTSFRDIDIRAAITSSTVVNSVDFAILDADGDGDINHKELQIILIVAGGEESYGDAGSKSIWAHAWSYESNNAPNVDGVNLMRYTGVDTTSGNYVKFGATHDIDNPNTHKATIGIMAHELGHSLLNLDDYYPTVTNNNGSGLGYYDIMSGGSWARKNIDSYQGDTPVQFSAFNKIDAKLDINLTTISSSTSLSIKCSSNDLVKLTTAQSSEYFLLECRDSARVDSDRSFNHLDSAFTDNKLFSFIYHVDENKDNNNESGTQTSSNHYKVRLVERDESSSLTSNDDVKANYEDSYTDGNIIEATKTESYSGVLGYRIEILNSDYTNRTMTFRITK